MTSTLRIRCAVVALAGLAVADCASFQSSSGAPVAREGTRVEISNNNWATAAVYAVRGGMRSRIGTVETGQTALLRLPWSTANEDVHVLVHLVGGGDYVSPAVPGMSGGRISLTVQNQLPLSFLSVR
jgi:hypothetical protein